MYQQAMSQAASASKKTLEARAALFLAFEELRSGSPDALTAVERALHLSSADSSADFRLLRERLKNAIETNAKSVATKSGAGQSRHIESLRQPPRNA